ncbi:hypothetical protein ACHAQJ_006507 [Trichoderma viride]
MAHIYNYASNVCIWLGDGFENAASAFTLVREIMNFKKFDTKVQSFAIKDTWIQLIEIMKAPWFSRRWIIQEVALSKSASLHYADSVVHWDDFADAVSLLLENIGMLRNSFHEEIFEDVEITNASILIQCLDSICRKSQKGDVLAKLLDLETLVSTLLGFQVTVPRDTIYSVLSLANDTPGEDESWTELHSEQLASNWVNDCIEPATDDILRDLKRRQNGENFVAHLPHGRRHRYSACGSYLAKDFSMAPDPSLDLPAHHGSPQRKRLRIDSFQNILTQPNSSSATLPHALTALSPINNRSSWISGNTTTTLTSAVDGVYISPQTSQANAFSSQGSDTAGPQPILLVSDPSEGTTGLGLVGGPEAPRSNRHSLSKKSRQGPTRPLYTDVERKCQLSGIIMVSGLVLGKIKNQSDVMRGGIIPGEWVSRLGWNTEKTENRVPDTLWRLLVADRAIRGGKPPSWYQRACLHGLVDPRVSDNEGNIHSVTPMNRKISEMTTEYFRRVETVVWNRRLFEAEADITCLSNIQKLTPETKQALIIYCKDIRSGSALGPKDLFGLAPRETKEGDLVCILFGCTVPVVLRPMKDPEFYQLVGEAYVHGVMDGEAMLSSEVVNRMKRHFKIC